MVTEIRRRWWLTTPPLAPADCGLSRAETQYGPSLKRSGKVSGGQAQGPTEPGGASGPQSVRTAALSKAVDALYKERR